jgi:chromosome segregation protein
MERAVTARLERSGSVTDERGRLEEEVVRLRRETELRATELKAVEDVLAPDDESLRDAARRTREESLALDGLRLTTQAAEAAMVEARLDSARADSQLERILEHLAADADLLPAAAAFAEVAGSQSPRLPEVEALADGLEGRITRVRSQLRDLGAIDAEALATYRETAEHHQLLTEQRADLLAAESDVASAIGELEADMATRFGRTFETVAREFQTSFPALFGGGEAKLELDGETGGIEIMARPPGKRAQPLALLSGGERSLTAVALVFALLRASETPFVVLDEVDAALDEANVDRFRAALEELAKATQVVIVTHNRGTVQTASTVYGVSMGEDGASQTLSVRVDNVARA